MLHLMIVQRLFYNYIITRKMGNFEKLPVKFYIFFDKKGKIRLVILQIHIVEHLTHIIFVPIHIIEKFLINRLLVIRKA